MTDTAKWSGYFKIVTPQHATTKMTDSQEMADAGAYNNSTWYQRLIQGSASRMTRYREYSLMNNDIDVSRGLDTIAEEMTGNNPKSKEPLLIDILSEDEDNVDSVAVLTLKAALRRWGQIHKFNTRLYRIARHTIMYGDVFFRKQKTNYDIWQFIHPQNVVAAIVDVDDATKIVAWQIKTDIKKPRTGGYGLPMGAKETTQHETEIVSAKELIRFSLSDDMSDTQPFGESVLRPVYRSHKQKELLEDAIIIYRIQRAPERRVFYIDVGKMPPQRVKQYLESIKNEIKQKKVPTMNGGQSEIDSVYNPQSMSEDFFFACLSMSSEVLLLDGRTLTIDELRKEYEEGKTNQTYSIDQQTGKKIIGNITWAGFTRQNAEMVRVHLNNNTTIDCTPDHKFIIDTLEEIQAQELKSETLLASFDNQLSVIKVEKLDYREDTGCIHVEDDRDNHNFALAAGVYVKNSRPDGRGSRVDTLPGGQGLGELTDLEYFKKKVWRGLKIPVSYMTDQGDGGQLFNDGKVGLAYIEELRFSLYIERLQGYLESTLDAEFKMFLRQNNIHVDESMYRVMLPEPSNFGKYKQLEIDSALLSTYASADGIAHLSPRFTMKRFLQLSDEEIITNERMKREELGLDPDSKDEADLQTLYGDVAGAEGAMGAGALGGGFGGTDLGLGTETPPGTETPSETETPSNT